MPLCTIHRDRIQARTLASDHRRNGSSRPVALVHLDSLLAPHEIQIFFFRENLIWRHSETHLQPEKNTLHYFRSLTFIRSPTWCHEPECMQHIFPKTPSFFPKIFSSDVPNWPGLGCSLGPSAQFRQGPGTAWRAALLDVPGTLGAPSGWDFPGRFKGYNHTIPYHTAINPMSIHQLGYHLYISLQLSYNDLITWNCTPKYPLPCLFRLLDAVRPCCSTISRWLGAFRSTEVARLC